jgi:hypothetical protein
VAGKAAADLLVEDNTQKGSMHTQSVIIVNAAELPEFVHEEIHVAPAGVAPGLGFPKDCSKKISFWGFEIRDKGMQKEYDSNKH